MNLDKTDFMCYNQDGAVLLNRKPSKLVDQFICLGSNISFTERDIDIFIGNARTAIGKLTTIWKFDLSDEIKLDFIQAVSVSVLLCGCPIWLLMKHLERKLGGNYTKIMCAVF